MGAAYIHAAPHSVDFRIADFGFPTRPPDKAHSRRAVRVGRTTPCPNRGSASAGPPRGDGGHPSAIPFVKDSIARKAGVVTALPKRIWNLRLRGDPGRYQSTPEGWNAFRTLASHVGRSMLPDRLRSLRRDHDLARRVARRASRHPTPRSTARQRAGSALHQEPHHPFGNLPDDHLQPRLHRAHRQQANLLFRRRRHGIDQRARDGSHRRVRPGRRHGRRQDSCAAFASQRSRLCRGQLVRPHLLLWWPRPGLPVHPVGR